MNKINIQNQNKKKIENVLSSENDESEEEESDEDEEDQQN